MTVKVVTTEQGEDAELVVCMRAADADAAGLRKQFEGRGARECPCAECGEAVFYAPTCPQRPPKVCLQCVTVKVRAARARGEGVDVMVNEEALR